MTATIVGVQKVPEEEVSKYGIIAPKGKEVEAGVIHVASLVEKPERTKAPSNYAIKGRYILRPEIFDILENLPPGAGNEIQLTDALNLLNKRQVVLAYNFEGIRYDVGDKIGFIKATIDFALQREDLRKDVLDYLSEIYVRELSKSGSH